MPVELPRTFFEAYAPGCGVAPFRFRAAAARHPSAAGRCCRWRPPAHRPSTPGGRRRTTDRPQPLLWRLIEPEEIARTVVRPASGFASAATGGAPRVAGG